MNRTECSAHFVPNLAEIEFAIYEMIFYGLFSLYQLNRATPHGAPSKPEKSRPIQHELCVHRAFNAFASYNITKTYHLSSSLQFLLSPLSRQFGMAVTDVLGYVSHLSWSWCLSAAICRRFLSNPAFSTVTSLWRRIASGTNAHSSRGTRYGREERKLNQISWKGPFLKDWEIKQYFISDRVESLLERLGDYLWCGQIPTYVRIPKCLNSYF